MKTSKQLHAFKLTDIYMFAIYLATVIAFLGICSLFIMLGIFALPVFLQHGSGSPFSWIWEPASEQFGILPMLIGSLLLSFSSILLAFPFALAICGWLVAIGRGRFLKFVKSIIYFMTAIPTVVYGFVAVFLLTPLIREALGGAGMCWLSATLMLTILILPTMVLVMYSGIQTKIEQLCPDALALGFTKLDLLWTFVLPQAKKTLLAATLLGLGRAMGDTLLPLMLAGNATQIPQQLTDSLRTLSAHMALVTANEVGGGAYNSLFAAGFLLLLINAVLSISARTLGLGKAMKG